MSPKPQPRDADNANDAECGIESSDRKKSRVSNTGRSLATLLVGFGVGVGLAILFAPQSGSETREWLSANAEDQFKNLRRRGRRLVFETQDLLDRGEQNVSRAMRTGKNVLDSLASKLD
jgi:gas vesicle protein